jgi:hypothetical protein
MVDLLQDQLWLIVDKQQSGHPRGPESAHIYCVGHGCFVQQGGSVSWPISCHLAAFSPRTKTNPPAGCAGEVDPWTSE